MKRVALRLLFMAASVMPACCIGQLTPFEGPDQLICTECPFPLVADLNDDGILDLIFADPSDTTIRWMEGVGDGTFLPALAIGSNQDQLQYELIGDVDGDGDLDLVGANPTTGLVALQRWVGGTYNQEVLDTVPPFTTALRQLDQLVDLDGDGHLDILGLFYQNPQDNRWYRAVENGSYEPRNFPGWCSSYSGDFEALDVDGDGDQDLVACGSSQLRLYVQWNLGSGPEGPFTMASAPLQPGAPGARMVDTADLNGDAFMDLVVGGRAAYASGTGQFEVVMLTSNSRFQSVGQVNCSPQFESVMSDPWSFGITVNTFTGLGAFIVQNSGSSIRTKATDVDGDGLADLVLGPGGGQDTVTWRRNPYGVQVTSLDFELDTIPADTVFELSGGQPTAGGGFYTGPGVFNDSLYSALAGSGWVTITYHHTSFIGMNDCEQTATDSLFIEGSVSVMEYRRSELIVFPDPANDRLFLRGIAHPVESVSVIDAAGRGTGLTNGIIAQDPGLHVVDIQHLSPGAYVLIVRDETQGLYRSRFLVVR